MSAVRRAIHIRTGSRAAADVIDAWLARHAVEVLPFADVYEACLHLLRHYEQVPDLLLLDAHWLARPEFGIICLARETWPHVGVIVYGCVGDTPSFQLTPFVLTCQPDAELQELIAHTPTDLLRKMQQQAASWSANRPEREAQASANVAARLRTGRPLAPDGSGKDPPGGSPPSGPRGLTTLKDATGQP